MIPSKPDYYVYTDPGMPAQRIQVVRDGEELCARFVDDDGAVELVPVKDMAGSWAAG